MYHRNYFVNRAMIRFSQAVCIIARFFLPDPGEPLHGLERRVAAMRLTLIIGVRS
jgi:hypothetical protein